jgi:hypothetical protein
MKAISLKCSITLHLTSTLLNIHGQMIGRLRTPRRTV